MTMGPLLNLAVWALVGVAALFLGLRIFCKVLRRLSLWWDDYILIAGWVSRPLGGSSAEALISPLLTGLSRSRLRS